MVRLLAMGDLQEMNENNTPLEMNRVLLNKNPDEKMKKHGGSKAGSRVVLYHEESQGSVPQIEKQQSSLLDILQDTNWFTLMHAHWRK
ncbi:hypothetical protein P8452_48208 [Trifolium repens]|nr:hypothetical protein P8452_48208 [Trifolium repens]